MGGLEIIRWEPQGGKEERAAASELAGYVVSQQGVSGIVTSSDDATSPSPRQVGHRVPSLQVPRPRQFGHFFALKILTISIVRMQKIFQLQTKKRTARLSGRAVFLLSRS